MYGRTSDVIRHDIALDLGEMPRGESSRWKIS